MLCQMPEPPHTLALFIAYLFQRHYAPSTVNTSVSAISYSSPVPRSLFYARLWAVIKLPRLDPLRYKGHSFRNGAAIHTADKGMSDAQVRAMGHWKSNASFKVQLNPVQLALAVRHVALLLAFNDGTDWHWQQSFCLISSVGLGSDHPFMSRYTL